MVRKFLFGLACSALFPLAFADAAITFYTSRSAFQAAAQALGKTRKVTIDFEGGVINPGQILAVNDPLGPGPNPPVFPNGNGSTNVVIQSNTLGGEAPQPSPRGTNGLAAANGVFNYPTKWVVANYFVDSIDYIMARPNHTAVGGDLISVTQSGPVRMRVYDKQEQLLGEQTLTVSPTSRFLGVVSDSATLGRINLFSLTNQAEGADDIEFWVPEPSSLTLLGLGALALLRRR